MDDYACCQISGLESTRLLIWDKGGCGFLARSTNSSFVCRQRSVLGTCESYSLLWELADGVSLLSGLGDYAC